MSVESINCLYTIRYNGSHIHCSAGRKGESIRVHQKYFKSIAAAKRWITMGLKAGLK